MDLSHATTRRLDHLGIVAGICDEIGLVEVIDQWVPGPRRQVSHGVAVKAMILNVLGFVSRALYLTPQFFKTKPVERLLGPGITAEMLNDDALGRTLDALYEAGLTKVFADVAHRALEVYGWREKFLHVDTTSFHVHGQYAGGEEPGVIRIQRGYSRDHRPDLKQVVVGLITMYRQAIPVWIQALSGGEPDARSLPQLIEGYLEQMRQGEEEIYFVADAAFYTEENLRKFAQIPGVYWIARVPNSVQEAVWWQEEIRKEEMVESQDPAYRYKVVEATYGGVPQRWLVVHSQHGEKRDIEQISKKLIREKRKVEKELARIARREYESKEAVWEAVREAEEKWAYHGVKELGIRRKAKYSRAGRPRKGSKPDRVVWVLEGWEIEEKEEEVERLKVRAGKFVLGTNQVSAEALSAEEVLRKYRGQNQGPERSFRFLKDPMFFADSFFLKSPKRIMALVMIMGLALLIYALAERKLRESLKETGESLPNQVGKPTQRPTMRWIFQMFEGIDVLCMKHPQQTQEIILNLTDIHRKVLKLLGPEVEKYYLDSS